MAEVGRGEAEGAAVEVVGVEAWAVMEAVLAA